MERVRCNGNNRLDRKIFSITFDVYFRLLLLFSATITLGFSISFFLEYFVCRKWLADMFLTFFLFPFLRNFCNVTFGGFSSVRWLLFFYTLLFSFVRSFLLLNLLFTPFTWKKRKCCIFDLPFTLK